MTAYLILGGIAACGLALWYFYSEGKSSGASAQQASDDVTADEASEAELKAATQAPADRAGVVDELRSGKF